MATLIDDTIAAISTPIGKSGIGVIRLSGQDARKITESVLSSPQRVLQDHTTTLRSIKCGRSGRVLDQIMVTYFQAPRSFTREDVVELGCHGNPVILKAVLGLLLDSGARLATPGEFTLRAYLRGRIDLIQAEGIRAIIEAKTLFQAQIGRQQASGSLSRRVSPVKDVLVRLIAMLEAGIDFADDDVSITPDEEIERQLERISDSLKSLEASFPLGRLVSEGLSVAIVGRTNVGKSTLFNSILAQDRSIVSATPGTTRDMIAESGELEGVPVRWMDTAGIRGTADSTEKIGIEKTKETVADADKVLLVLDGSSDLTGEDLDLYGELKNQPFCLVINKIDRPQRLHEARLGKIDGPVVRVSALTGEGVDVLKGILVGELEHLPMLEKEGAFVTNLRHQQLIGGALAAAVAAASSLSQGLPHEVILLDLYRALRALNALTGETTVEDILENIFATFCIGK